MSLDPRYMVTPALMEYYVDKDTGLPLAAGIITFYSDINRTDLKAVYTLSGSAPNYSYVPLPNPMTLNSIGTPSVDGTNNVLVYYYPYDDNGDLELYYITVESSGHISQFTRQGWPNIGSQSTGTESLENFVSNGKFLTHNNIQTDGIISNPITEIAAGGWSFRRPMGSTATDIITFPRFNSFITNPSGNPRYSLRVQTTVASAGDTFKDIYLLFNDVNTFASDVDTYTYFFQGISNTGSSINAQLLLVKNFGTGGSSTTFTGIGNITFTPTETPFNFPFIPGNNDGKTIGTLNDDYVAIVIRLPTNIPIDIELTTVVLSLGDLSLSIPPIITDEDVLARTGYQEVPNYDGYDLYLPYIWTLSGWKFDDSSIGNVESETQTSLYVSSLHPTSNKMLADGNTYKTTDYSPLGIPFSRLLDKYWISALNTPRYGTGSSYFTLAFSGTGNAMSLINNSPGILTQAADVSTGFTISNISIGAATYYVKAFLISPTVFYLQNLNIGTVTTQIAAGTSGFTVTQVRVSGPKINSISAISTIAATGLAGDYFTFQSINNSASQVSYYVWYKVNGSGADPTPGGTGILVKLLSTDTATIVAQKTQQAVNAWEADLIQTVAASAITASSYFTATSTSQNYYIWYTKDGTGTDPAVSGKIGIKVAVLSADTNTQVASKTQNAINSLFFSSPDFRNLFLRGYDGGQNLDFDRYSLVPGVIGDILGTFQTDEIYSHYHLPADNTSFVTSANGGAGNFNEGSQQNRTTVTGYTGGIESRPINANVNFSIRY